MRSGDFNINNQVYASSNVEFNYANCLYAKKHQFIALAKELVPDNERVNEKKLEYIASQMNCILTFTNVKSIDRPFRLYR
jgi:hypothetical protein